MSLHESILESPVPVTSAEASSGEGLVARIRALEAAATALDPGEGERRRIHDAIDAVVERFLSGLDTLPAFRRDDRGVLSGAISEGGIAVESAVEILESEVLGPGGNPASPRHLAYITGGGLYHAALADYLAAASNKFAGLAATGPGPVRIENAVVRWAADLVGYPASAGGHVASGGSLATLSAVTAARDAHRLRATDFDSAVTYITEQAHHCIEKALRIAGMADSPVRRVPMDERYRMRADALAEAIARDRLRGLRPWLVVATAGTTDTGAVDPLEAMADVTERERCWFHVDAAYGGFFLLTEHGRRVLAGIERSDSVVLDPHKSLFLPWGAGMVLARDIRSLLVTHGATGSYLQDAVEMVSDPSPADVSPELTKPFRALKIWLPLVMVGAAAFRAALQEKLLLARHFHSEIAAAGFEVGPVPDLSIVHFRWAPPGATPEETDRMNQRIIARLRDDGELFLSSTTIDGRFMLRSCFLSFRTHLAVVDLAVRLLKEQVVLFE